MRYFYPTQLVDHFLEGNVRFSQLREVRNKFELGRDYVVHYREAPFTHYYECRDESIAREMLAHFWGNIKPTETHRFPDNLWQNLHFSHGLGLGEVLFLDFVSAHRPHSEIGLWLENEVQCLSALRCPKFFRVVMPEHDATLTRLRFNEYDFSKAKFDKNDIARVMG